jgi:hypothetical protein
VNPSSNSRSGSQEVVTARSHRDDWRLEKLIDRLPPRLSAAVRFLRRPSGVWLRIPAGLLLIVGGIFAFLPILGLWMLPLGLALLAEDIPLLRSLRSRVLDWIERRHPHWLEPRPRSDDVA